MTNPTAPENSPQPKVTAILPCHNAAEFIRPTLESLARQTWCNLEILIGDDCSTDTTLKIVQKFAATHKNVSIIPRERNLGWVDNSNDLAAHATGEFMFFAFHDDILQPTFVEKMVQALNDNPRASLAFSDVEQFALDGQSTILEFTNLSNVRSALVRGWKMRLGKTGWWAGAHGMFKASTFRQIGGLKRHATGEYSADFPWIVHLALLGEFVRVPELLVQKYFKVTSLSKVWKHSLENRKSLAKATTDEIWGSNLDLITRSVLCAIFRVREEMRHLQREYRQYMRQRARRRDRRLTASRPPAQKIGDQS